MSDLAQLIVKAMTNPDNPVQPEPEKFSPELHRQLGPVPLPVRHLKVLAEQLAAQQEEITRRIDGSNLSELQTKNLIQEGFRLYLQHQAVTELMRGLVLETLTKLEPEERDFYAVTFAHDWQMVGVKYQPLTEENLLAQLMAGGGVLTIGRESSTSDDDFLSPPTPAQKKTLN